MASQVETANIALQKLGVKRIISLTDDSVNARAANTAYEPCKRRLLEKNFWNFSIKRANLAASSTEPLFNKAYAYPVPSDFIKLAPTDQDDNSPFRDWQIEGREIITNDTAPLPIRYVRDVTDPNEMTPLFREAHSLEMALQMCDELTQSNTKKQLIKAELDEVIAMAKKSNAIQNPPVEAPEDSWLTSRV